MTDRDRAILALLELLGFSPEPEPVPQVPLWIDENHRLAEDTWKIDPSIAEAYWQGMMLSFYMPACGHWECGTVN